MNSNVVRHLRRPCGLTQCRKPIITQLGRRYLSEDTEEQARPLRSNREENLYLLRIADQKYLRDTKAQTTDLINHVNKIQDHVASLPLTVQNDPKIPPYTLGYARKLFTGKFVEEAYRTIKAAEHAKEHLTDLQYEPYKDKGSNVLVQFEKEVESWTEEQKRETLKRWEFEIEAKLDRLNRGSRKLVSDVQAIAEQNKKVTPMPTFKDEKSSSSKDEKPTSKERKSGEKKAGLAESASKTAVPQTTNLRELQSRLQASINMPKEK